MNDSDESQILASVRACVHFGGGAWDVAAAESKVKWTTHQGMSELPEGGRMLLLSGSCGEEDMTCSTTHTASGVRRSTEGVLPALFLQPQGLDVECHTADMQSYFQTET